MKLTTPDPKRPKPRTRPETDSRIERHPDDCDIELLTRLIQTPHMRQVGERGDTRKGEITGLAIFGEPGVLVGNLLGGEICGLVVAVREDERDGSEC